MLRRIGGVADPRLDDLGAGRIDYVCRDFRHH